MPGTKYTPFRTRIALATRKTRQTSRRSQRPMTLGSACQDLINDQETKFMTAIKQISNPKWRIYQSLATNNCLNSATLTKVLRLGEGRQYWAR